MADEEYVLVDEAALECDRPRCANCRVNLKVQEAKAAGSSLFDIALGVGKSCADCERNPGLGMVAGIMAAFGVKPKDRWEAIQDEDLEPE